MRKSIIFISTILFANFLPNQTYNCTSIGVSMEKNGKKYSIIKTPQNSIEIQKMLKDLNKIKINLNKSSLKVKISNTEDSLPYANKYNNLDVYVTKDKSLAVFVDDNASQIGVNIISNGTTIYYQCK